MQYKTFGFFIQLVIFYNQYNFINVKALVGYNVRDAVDGEFPAVVCIAKVAGENFVPDEVVKCGGALVTQNHVLTAEHCLEMVQISLYTAIVGSVNIMVGLRRTPLWWMSYEQWALTLDVELEFEENDIGMLKLIEIEDSHYNTALIYSGFNYQLAGLFINLVGWGLTNAGYCPAILQTANATIVSNSQCETLVNYLDPRDDVFIHDRYICTIARPYVLVDSGDSGSPVLFQNIVIAVTRGTMPYLNGSFHGLKVNCHTGIAHYRIFINDSVLM